MMILNSKYRIIKESETLILQFHEMREKTKKDESKELYEYTENYFYPTIQSALQAFLHKSLEDSEDVKDCLERIKTAEKQILSALKQTI